jgi:hypothetical protein
MEKSQETEAPRKPVARLKLEPEIEHVKVEVYDARFERALNDLFEHPRPTFVAGGRLPSGECFDAVKHVQPWETEFIGLLKEDLAIRNVLSIDEVQNASQEFLISLRQHPKFDGLTGSDVKGKQVVESCGRTAGITRDVSFRLPYLCLCMIVEKTNSDRTGNIREYPLAHIIEVSTEEILVKCTHPQNLESTSLANESAFRITHV